MDTHLSSIFAVVAGVSFAASLLLFITSTRKLAAEALLILAVLTACLSALWPPAQKLKLGPDLAGGTSLLYEVAIPRGANVDDTINRVIEVVRRRVDPNGVRNLQFQAESGGRVQILMPQPSEDVVQLRKNYQAMLLRLGASNLSVDQVRASLALEAEARKKRLAEIAAGVPGRDTLLNEVAAAYDARQEAQKAYDAIGGKELTDEKVAALDKLTTADKKLSTAMSKLENSELDPTDVGRVLELSNIRERDPQTKAEKPGTSPRDIALADLLAKHPDRQNEITDLVAAYDAYYSTKRPLDDPNDLIRLLQGQGVLEFRIAANPGEAPDANAMRQTLKERGPRATAADAPLKWFMIDDPSKWINDSVESIHRQDTDRPKKEIEAELQAQLKADPASFFMAHAGLIAGSDGKNYYALLFDTPDKSITNRVPGWSLTNAYPTQDSNTGFPAVGFQLNDTGGGLMGDLTKNNLQRSMAIVLDGRVYSAPRINQQIRDSGIITGRFTRKEIDYLVNTLAAGSLQAKLSDQPIEVRTIQPTLGRDNLYRGLNATFISFVAVSGFMIVYYFFGGLIAVVALTANIVIVLGVMAMFNGTFTLPGIAGIVLTIGIAVDANVLIFERIREELARGVGMVQSLRLGYERAFSAIFDGHVTTLITCLVLFYAGAADVKGFGLTLAVGTAASLFTSLFMTRVIYTAWYRWFPGHRMTFLPIAVPAVHRVFHRNIDWIGLRYKFFLFSSIVCVASIVLVGAHWHEMLDIEFRAGTEVAFDLKKVGGQKLKLTRNEVAAKLQGKIDSPTVVVVGDMDEKLRASSFSVITAETDAPKVSAVVQQVFADVLDIQPVVRFKGVDAKATSEAPVFPITQAKLGAVINRPGLDTDVSDYRGGVAVVLEQMDPPLPIETVEQRIHAIRLSPEFEKLAFRPFKVVGLDRAETGNAYTSVAVISNDPAFSYFDDAERWEQQNASVEWHVVREALTRPQSLSKVSNFSPSVAQTIANNALMSLFLSIFFIVAFVWFRFGTLRYGLAAIATVVHDVIVAMGFVAISPYLAGFLLIEPFHVNMTMIAAMLTIIGYSLNDTIVVFDRIRENRGKLAYASPEVMNDAINQTLSRTILTSSTVLIAVIVLYIVGGEAIRGFAYAMFIGVFTGTYSSIAVGSPLLLLGTPFAKSPSRKQLAAKNAGNSSAVITR
jgi:SecD/SecF fusion protein